MPITTHRDERTLSVSETKDGFCFGWSIRRDDDDDQGVRWSDLKPLAQYENFYGHFEDKTKQEKNFNFVHSTSSRVRFPFRTY